MKKSIISRIVMMFIMIVIAIMLPITSQAATKKKAVTIKTKIAVSSSSNTGKTLNIGASTNVKSTLSYKSSNKKIATVTSKGVIKTLSAGTVKIIVTAKPKSTKNYKTTTKTITIRVVKPVTTYKIVYHYSQITSTKNVTKTVTVGTKPKLASASSLGFTSSSHIFLGWNVYRTSTKKWMLYNKSLTGYTWGTYNKSNLYTFTSGTELTESIKAKEEIHVYGQWVNKNGVNINLPYFQENNVTKSSGLVDSTKTIQAALDIANKTSLTITVKVPEGTYYISDALHVYSNTNLVLENATIRRTVTTKKYMVYVGTGVTSQGGYTQAKNITIKGGTWIANPKTTYNPYTAMYFAHAQNITVKDLTIENYSGKHAMAFAAIKNGTVSNVTIEDYVECTTKGWLYNAISSGTETRVKQHAEAIHVDNATLEGEPDGKPCDNTLSTGITVKNCVLDNVLCGIGSHVKNDAVGGTIEILSNEFHDVKYRCLNIYNKESVKVSGNKVYLYGTFKYFYNNTSADEDENEAYTITDTDKGSMRSLYLNVISNVKSYTFSNGGAKATKYQYFLHDLNNDGIRELIVAALFTKDSVTYRDCIIFTCRKSSGSYTLKKLYGSFVADTLYLPSSNIGLYNRVQNSTVDSSTIYRITITANTIVETEVSTFANSADAADSFTEANTKVVWISSANTTALRSITQ